MRVLGRGQTHDKACAFDDAVIADNILGRDSAPMRLDDLFGYGQTQAGMGAEFLAFGTFGIEAVEDVFFLAGGNARALVLDENFYMPMIAHRTDADDAARRAEGHSIADQIAEDLTQAGLEAGNNQRAVGSASC